jgi:DNA-binding response OmpR family regulator
MKTLILIVEDDRKIAAIVKAYLESSGYAVLSAQSAKEAIELFSKEIPSLVLLDLALPDGAGEELIQDFKSAADIPVIMVTAKSSEEERLAGFALGADDYIVKPFSPKELIARVKAVLKRFDKMEGSKLLSFDAGRLVIDGTAHEVTKEGRAVQCSQTEFKMLSILASSPGKVFSRLELVEKVMGYQFEGYERTVDAHIKNLRRKLDEDPKNPKYIQTIFGIGYKFLGKRDESKHS